MTPPVTTHDLLRSELAFLAEIQNLGFGRYEYLQIRGGELILNPRPTTVRGVKFGTPLATGKPAAANSVLQLQIAEFFAYVRDVAAGEIRELEVRHGLPFSMEIELPGSKDRIAQGGRCG